MIENNYIQTRLIVPIYTDRPNKDGMIYPKYAIENALKNTENIPLVNRVDDKCLGYIKSIGFKRDINEDGENEIILDCYLFNGGFEYIVNKKRDNVIQDFTITSFSL